MGSIRKAGRFLWRRPLSALFLGRHSLSRRGSVQTAAKEFTMRFKFLSSLAVVAGLCFAAVAMAQQPGQPGQPGGRGRGGPPGGGGFGMFGGFGTSRLRL